MRHGKYSSRVYNIWKGMIQRCENPNNTNYARYGGKGITVCKEWKDFVNFYRDMGEPCKGFSLDRIDGSKGYSADNCRWADRSTQSYNQGKRNDNLSGLAGVFFNKHRRKWIAYYGKAANKLYYGGDFFEACCARKSFELTI